MLALVCAAGFSGGAPASAQESTPRLTPDGVLKPGDSVAAALDGSGDEVRLSNETTITRVANAATRAAVRTRPSRGARKVARLRFTSGSLAPEIYGLLQGRVDRRGRAWLKVRVAGGPDDPKGSVGWAPAGAFTAMRVVRTQLIVDRNTLRVTFFRRGRKVLKAPVGVGKASTPTPDGHYFIDRKEGAIFGPSYGTHILFTTAYTPREDWPGGGAVGMHGTSQPELVPGRPSHGCIRMHNADVDRLWPLVPIGTPLLIR